MVWIELTDFASLNKVRCPISYLLDDVQRKDEAKIYLAVSATL